MRRRALLFFLLIIVGAIVAGSASDTIADRFNSIPPQVSFDQDWKRLDELDAAIIKAIFEQLEQRQAASRVEGGVYIPEPPPPEVLVEGWSQWDLQSARVKLRLREERITSERQNAIRARDRQAEQIADCALIAFWLAVAGIAVILLGPIVPYWRFPRRTGKRLVSGLFGIRIAERVGVFWGVLERAAAPLRDAFGRGRRQAHAKDVDSA